MSSTPTDVPAALSIRPLAMGEASETPAGRVILADAGDTLLHVALPGACVHFLLNPEETIELGRDLVRHGIDGRKRRRRGE